MWRSLDASGTSSFATNSSFKRRTCQPGKVPYIMPGVDKAANTDRRHSIDGNEWPSTKSGRASLLGAGCRSYFSGALLPSRNCLSFAPTTNVDRDLSHGFSELLKAGSGTV